MLFFIHYFLHLIFPAFVARWINKSKWINIYLVFLSTMLVDVDHMLATPVFDPYRCSIGFHPLHSYLAIAVYVLLLAHRRSRIVGIGLLMHMATDGLDCLLM